jgi:protein-S-isoprenylcysteine O-methyltransferase Ste14
MEPVFCAGSTAFPTAVPVESLRFTLTNGETVMVRRLLILTYGIMSYVLSLAIFVYTIGFVGGFLAPTHLDDPRHGSLAAALAIDGGLVLLFALQHSGMARPAFKRWLTRFIPEPAERSTYVLLSSAALFVLFWQWQPLGGNVWEVKGDMARSVALAVYAAGWVIVLATTFCINHLDLFGLRQVWLAFRGIPYTPLGFATPGPYRLVRHPLYIGWFTVFWAAPTMTAAHLIFALGMTAYILAAIRWEERDLIAAHPEYAAYRGKVPMLVPRFRVGQASSASGDGLPPAARETGLTPTPAAATSSAR